MEYDWHQASSSHVIVSSASASGRTAYVLLAQSSCSSFSKAGAGASSLLSSTHLHDLDRQDGPSPPQTLFLLLVASHQSSHEVVHGSTQG